MSLDYIYNKNEFHYRKKISLSINHMADIFHKPRGTSRCICQKASMTVEAAAVAPFFVCFMVFVLYFFRILQVQAGILQALQYAGRRVAAECNIQPESNASGQTGTAIGGNASKEKAATGGDAIKEKVATGGDAIKEKAAVGGAAIKARVFFQKQLKNQNCPLQYVHMGMAGISLLQSDFSGNFVDLKAVYRMKLPIRLLGNIQFQIVQEAKCRKWTGYQPGQDTEEQEGWLYYTEFGSVYHATRSCAYLDLSIQGVANSQVSNRRNHSGGKYYACEKCANQLSHSAMVYITDYGDRYHSSLTCGALKRSIYMIRKSKATNKKMCSKCG